ncbi:MAG: oligosaccharide flippase family protein [Pseudorhodobacter sp.]
MQFRKFLTSDTLRGRALRGTAITLGSSLGQQAIRLASNLILTRLLFPEAFGLMALIQTFVIGLEMFSDVGLQPSIVQNRRGTEPNFLNTAWTIGIIRGFVLWFVACALAWPLSVFYDNSQMLYLLPVVGFNAVISGFITTKTAVAFRKINLGMQAALSLGGQAVGVVAMITIAYLWPSVWALVIGGLIGNLVDMLLHHRFLPGERNRLCWDRSAISELISFGQYIFLSTIAAFIGRQGDKLILGKLVSLFSLGIYNIAFFLANFPTMLGEMVAGQILFPLYSERRPSENIANMAKLKRARNLVTGSLIALNLLVGLIGVGLVNIMYDARYTEAGPMLVIMALSQIPPALLIGNSQLLLAEGNSRDFSIIVWVQAALHITGLLVGYWLLGMFGVLLVPGLVAILYYPLQQYFLAKHAGVDLRRDAIFALIGLVLGSGVIFVNLGPVSEFVGSSIAGASSNIGAWIN